MVALKYSKVKGINERKVATDFTKWCNDHSSCLYKSKKRKYHGWLNLDNLKNGKTAQCGYDNGDCNHTTAHGIGGYHNVCPIGGINGDYPWPAKLQFSDFNLKQNNITSDSKVKSITISFEHRMNGIGTKTGKAYYGNSNSPNFGGNAVKVYFTAGDKTVSKVVKFGNPNNKEDKKYTKVSHKFTDITITELLKSDFAFNIEYNHNTNTNPGIIYLKNVKIDISYSNAKKFINGSSNTSTLFTGTEDTCITTIKQTIQAGYKSGDKITSYLTSKIKNTVKPTGVTVTESDESTDKKKVYIIKDKSNKAGTKSISYALNDDAKTNITLKYTATKRDKPSYSFIQQYKANEDFDSSKQYISFKNGCASRIRIFIDSINSEPLTFTNLNQNSSTNLLREIHIKQFHDEIKTQSCGRHVLYIQRGDETIAQAQKNQAIIYINPMNFKFDVYKKSDESRILEFTQDKDDVNRYEEIVIKRIDDEPMAMSNQLLIYNGTKPNVVVEPIHDGLAKGDTTTITIDKYYAGQFYITINDDSVLCPSFASKFLIDIKSFHHQNFDYLFTRGEYGTAFDFDYLVAWEGDNISTPLKPGDIEVISDINDITICSDSVESNLSVINTIPLVVTNTSDKAIEGIDIELNTLVENENGELEVTTSEWTNTDGIFNQFYELFNDYNQTLNNNVEIRNLSPDNDLIDEENVYLSINRIEADSSLRINLPFRSVVEKKVYLQYLILEQPMEIKSISNCRKNASTDNYEICVEVLDAILTNLEITGETDLLTLDNTIECPDECYTMKEQGITYKITNIDTNDFEDQVSNTLIINDVNLMPTKYILHGIEYNLLLDNNGNPIPVQEMEPKLDLDGNPELDEDGNIKYQNNKLNWIRKIETSYNQPVANHNLECQVSFPNLEPIKYTVKTDKNGLAQFYIPIPETYNEKYTVEDLLNEIVCFRFKETDQYNEAILTNQNVILPSQNELKNTVNLKVEDNYRKYKPGETAYIAVSVLANIKSLKNYFSFDVSLRDAGDSDEVTIFYKICNIEDNEGIFKTTFKTNSKQLIQNETSKNIYCGVDSDVTINKKLAREMVEQEEINVIYIDAQNGIKENKDVLVFIDLGDDLGQFKGNYDFLDINIDVGDYSIEEVVDEIKDSNGDIIETYNHTVVQWLIGEMDSNEIAKCIIKIKAKDIGLSKIVVKWYDYIHNKDSTIPIKQSICEKCENNTSTYKIANSQWEEHDGILYKRIDGVLKRRIYQNNELVWVNKE